MTLPPTTTRQAPQGRFLAALLVAAAAAAGCGQPAIDGTYGLRHGRQGGQSVAGTAVLAGMYEKAGYRVFSWRRLSPRLKQADVIVWAPNSFDPPRREERAWLEEWLRDEPGRTLVYIGRDYDALSAYWRIAQQTAPPEQAAEIARRLAMSRAEHLSQRQDMPPNEYADWFTTRRDRPARTVAALEGPWSAGIDPKKANIELKGLLEVPKPSDDPDSDPHDLRKFEVLLSSDGDPIVTRVSRVYWTRGRILVVANGSFLLNLPLVNHEHRKLAGKLIEASGSQGTVAFLESGPAGLTITERDGETRAAGFEALTVWPIGLILLHLFCLGILYCVSRFPIFGRPRELEPETRSDFGKHIEALGELLEQTGERDYALARVNHYHQHVRRESGSSHLQPGRSAAPRVPVVGKGYAATPKPGGKRPPPQE
jgi:hypothetical protein